MVIFDHDQNVNSSEEYYMDILSDQHVTTSLHNLLEIYTLTLEKKTFCYKSCV